MTQSGDDPPIVSKREDTGRAVTVTMTARPNRCGRAERPLANPRQTRELRPVRRRTDTGRRAG